MVFLDFESSGYIFLSAQILHLKKYMYNVESEESKLNDTICRTCNLVFVYVMILHKFTHDMAKSQLLHVALDLICLPLNQEKMN